MAQAHSIEDLGSRKGQGQREDIKREHNRRRKGKDKTVQIKEEDIKKNSTVTDINIKNSSAQTREKVKLETVYR